MQFIRISGGLDGGSEPPAFQRAERERLMMACADEMAADSLLEPAILENSCTNLNVLPVVFFCSIYQLLSASFA